MKILYLILLLPSLSFGHTNDTARQLKERVAAQQLHKEYCSKYNEIEGYLRISRNPLTLCKACELFESMKNGDELLSDEELQQNYCNACIEHYAKEFKSPKDSEQLTSFCSEQADDFVRIVKSSINKVLKNGYLSR